MPLGCLIARLELQTPNNIEDGVLGEHDLEQGVFVQKENIPEKNRKLESKMFFQNQPKYLVQMMKPLHVLQIFTDVENIQKFLKKFYFKKSPSSP